MEDGGWRKTSDEEVVEIADLSGDALESGDSLFPSSSSKCMEERTGAGGGSDC